MFNVMILKLFALYKDEEGQALAEYGLDPGADRGRGDRGWIGGES